MNWTLELIVVPVSDIDRSKAFYTDQVGFTRGRRSQRRRGLPRRPAEPDRLGLLDRADEEPADGAGRRCTACTCASRTSRPPGRSSSTTASMPATPSTSTRPASTPGSIRSAASYATFLTFHDPDGNTWLVQEKKPVDSRRMTAAALGEDAAFAALTERHRRELHVHCYRMLASFDEAEDAVQETMLRAWGGRDRFDGSSLFRAWLYRIATNVCLDSLRRRSRRLTSIAVVRRGAVAAAVPGPAARRDRPDGRATTSPTPLVVERETIELVFLAALQVLPPRQRAALIARDVLGWPAAETAALLGTSVPAANSALQRARATMQQHLPARRADWAARRAEPEERALLERIHRRPRTRRRGPRGRRSRRTDLRITMPPQPLLFEGLDVDRAAARPARSARRAASGGSCRPAPTGCRRPRATCAARATRSSGRSSSTCCASSTAGSPRSRPSAPSCSRRSACR